MDSTRFSLGGMENPGTNFDVVIAGDHRVACEATFRTANQTLIHERAGYRTGLLHVPCAKSQVFPFINPEVDRLIRAGQALAIDPAVPLITTQLLLVESATAMCQRVMDGERLDLPRILADKAIALLDEAMPLNRLRQYHAIIAALFGTNIVWAATTAEARTSLTMAEIPCESAVWIVSVAIEGAPVSMRGKRKCTILGRTAFSGTGEWPAAASSQFAQAYPTGDGRVMKTLALPWLNKTSLDAPDDWQIMTLRHISCSAFLRGLDFFLYYPGDDGVDLPGHAMAWAMAHGVPVIADPMLRGRLGKGPVYVPAGEVAALLEDDGDIYREWCERCVTFARQKFGPHVHLQRLEDLIGPPKLQRPRLVGQAKKKRVLFTCTNGMGIGHVTRLLSVARQLPSDMIPVFAILNPAAHLVRQAGFPVEYIASAGSAMCDPAAWTNWYRDELIRIMDFHDIQGIMFDGGRPFQGLISAMRARPQARSIWMRRGLWQEQQVNSSIIARQHYFDLVMEPADIAESWDKGETVANQSMVTKVDPIQLVSEDELMDRDEAAARIGLDPKRPACLLQFGAGSNRDQMSLMDGAISALNKVDGMQIVVARWPITTHDLDFWPNTICIRGFPTSRYYRAFDFTISATGYNSFHEIINFGLPAIFMANTHTALDDQVARAEFAQDNDAGFHLPDTRIDAIGGIIDSIMDGQTRTIIESNCRRLSRPNGATQAAEIFAELLG